MLGNPPDDAEGEVFWVMTSPPYCNRYDYTRTYALELAMLGVDEAGLVKLRQEMLSCTVENRAKDLLAMNPAWQRAISVADEHQLLQSILRYLDNLREANELNNTDIPRMVRGYFYEMACVIAECGRILKQSAPLIMVNDNVRYAGASVSVDLILSDFADQLGFKVESILVLPNGKGNSDLLKLVEIQDALLTAAGISDKAATHLLESDKRDAIEGLIKNFLEPEGTDFIDELVYRFLLTRGDTLGGSMRNVGGFMAQIKLSRAIVAHLRNSGKPFRWLESGRNEWLDEPDDDTDIELRLRGLCWPARRASRVLMYNVTVSIVRNNIDLIVLDANSDSLSKATYGEAERYVALGELKGGIDPAGADEHWKTARTALNRIHTSFAKKKHRPKTFFIGAAVEAKMATEIWSMLKSGELDNAANLTSDDQVATLARWLCALEVPVFRYSIMK